MVSASSLRHLCVICMSELPQQIVNDRGRPAVTRVGTVTSTSPLLVDVQGATFTSIGRLSSYTPTLGDTVLVLGQSAITSRGTSWVILGKIV